MYGDIILYRKGVVILITLLLLFPTFLSVNADSKDNNIVDKVVPSKSILPKLPHITTDMWKTKSDVEKLLGEKLVRVVFHAGASYGARGTAKHKGRGYTNPFLVRILAKIPLEIYTFDDVNKAFNYFNIIKESYLKTVKSSSQEWKILANDDTVFVAYSVVRVSKSHGDVIYENSLAVHVIFVFVAEVEKGIYIVAYSYKYCDIMYGIALYYITSSFDDYTYILNGKSYTYEELTKEYIPDSKDVVNELIGFINSYISRFGGIGEAETTTKPTTTMVKKDYLKVFYLEPRKGKVLRAGDEILFHVRASYGLASDKEGIVYLVVTLDPKGKIKLCKYEAKHVTRGTDEVELKKKVKIPKQYNGKDVTEIYVIVGLYAKSLKKTLKEEKLKYYVGSKVVEFEIESGVTADFRPEVKPAFDDYFRDQFNAEVFVSAISVSDKKSNPIFKSTVSIGELILKPNVPKATYVLKIESIAKSSLLIDKFGVFSLFPEARIKYEVTLVKGNYGIYKLKSIKVLETLNCWIKPWGGDWTVVLKGSPPVEVKRGFKVRVRTYPAWESLLRGILVKVLKDANTGVSPAFVHMAPIEYTTRVANPKYDPRDDKILLPEAESMYSLAGALSHIDSFFHEFGHYLKMHYFPFTPTPGIQPTKLAWWTSVFTREWWIDTFLLGTPHQTTYKPYPVTLKVKKYLIFGKTYNIPLPLETVKCMGAFDEGHSEFLASLLTEYIRSLPYYNKVIPLKTEFYNNPKDYYGNAHLGGYDGATVEGRVAGFLLALLYGNPSKPDGNRVIQAYRMYWSVLKLGTKVKGFWPITIQEWIYLAVARYPSLWDKAITLASQKYYNIKVVLNKRYSPSGIVLGCPVIVYVNPSILYKVRPSGLPSGSYIVCSHGKHLVQWGTFTTFSAEPGSKVLLDAPAQVILFTPSGIPKALLVSALPNSQLIFEKGRIRLIGLAYGHFLYGPKRGQPIPIMVSGSNVYIIPRSKFIVGKVDENVIVATIEGNLEVHMGSQVVHVKSGEKIKISSKGEIIEKSKVNMTAFKESVWWYESDLSVEGEQLEEKVEKETKIEESEVGKVMQITVRDLIKGISFTNCEDDVKPEYSEDAIVKVAVSLDIQKVTFLKSPIKLKVLWIRKTDDENQLLKADVLTISPVMDESIIEYVLDLRQYNVEAGDKVYFILYDDSVREIVTYREFTVSSGDGEGGSSLMFIIIPIILLALVVLVRLRK